MRSDRRLTLRWWALVARGILALAFGIGVLVELVSRGDLQLRSYFLIFGVYALIDGALTFFVAWHVKNLVSPSGMFAFESLAALTVGLASTVLGLFGGNAVTLPVFSATIVVWAFATGAFEAASATMEDDFSLAIASLLSIGLGATVLGFRLAGVGEQPLLVVFAVYLLVVGLVYPLTPATLGEVTPFTNVFALRNHFGVMIDIYRRELDEYEAEPRIDPEMGGGSKRSPPPNSRSGTASQGSPPGEESASGTDDPGGTPPTDSLSDGGDPPIDTARCFLDRAETKCRAGDIASCAMYFYRANEEKITIRGKRRPEELHQLADRIVSISGSYFDETCVAGIRASLFTDERMTATPGELRNQWRTVYNAIVRRLKSVLVVRFLLRVFSIVLLAGLFVLGTLSLLDPPAPLRSAIVTAPQPPPQESSAVDPLHPFLVPVMVLGVLGSAVNNARTWTAQEPTLKLRQFEQGSAELSLSLSIALTRLLVGATAAVLLYFVVLTDIITISEESPALYLAIAFAAGFSDELVSKGVEKVLGTIVEKSDTPAADEAAGTSTAKTASDEIPSPALTVLVINRDDEPVSGANVTVAGKRDTKERRQRTKQSGEVQFDGLTADTYTVTVTKRGERAEKDVKFVNKTTEVKMTIDEDEGDDAEE